MGKHVEDVTKHSSGQREMVEDFTPVSIDELERLDCVKRYGSIFALLGVMVFLINAIYLYMEFITPGYLDNMGINSNYIKAQELNSTLLLISMLVILGGVVVSRLANTKMKRILGEG